MNIDDIRQEVEEKTLFWQGEDTKGVVTLSEDEAAEICSCLIIATQNLEKVLSVVKRILE